jgi:hypothetical protein
MQMEIRTQIQSELMMFKNELYNERQHRDILNSIR